MSTISQKAIIWARGRLRQQVGAGECWDLADQALRNAGGKSSTSTDWDDDYVWGTAIELKDVVPGDVLQFRDYVVTTNTDVTTSFADGSETDESTEETVERPHHTAIVDGNPGAGWLSILEQNVAPLGKKVQKHKLATRTMDQPSKTVRKTVKNDAGKWLNATIVTKVSITVSGTIWAYRPQSK